MASSSRVGVIANPYAGKDVRRLLAWAHAEPMAHLGQLLRRALRGIDAAGAEAALVMPDPYRLGEQALEGLPDLRMGVNILPMKATGTPLDTPAAVQAMADAGAAAVVVIGGDGTNRVVARAESAVPVLPVAYGTNNVFPWKVEAAVAGYAGGLFSRHGYAGCGRPAKRWRLWHKGEPTDLALVDVALSDDSWSGSRALWEPERIREIYTTFGGPAEIGLAGIGGSIRPVDRHAPHGLRVQLAPAGAPARWQVAAHLLPGYFATVNVAACDLVPPGVRAPLTGRGMLALDGERTVWCDGEEWEIELAADGPVVLDPHAILAAWSRTEFGPEEADPRSWQHRF